MSSQVNLLLIDDKEENLIALEALLARNDIGIHKTSDPNQALKIAWENNIDIALVDVQMPEMDGFELVELLKANPKTSNVLVIFVTAISKENKYVLRGLNTGAVDYLYKPLDPYITAAKVDSFIQLARSRRELQKKNRELENYATQVNNSADIICVLDPHNFRVLSVNAAVERVLGYQVEEFMGKSIIDFSVDQDESQIKRSLNEIMISEVSNETFEDRFMSFKKEMQWLECRVAKKNDLLMLNMSDITLNKNYTNELIRSRDIAEHARKLKENFLANMSHEIRTPINGIIGLTNILNDTQLDENQRRILDLIDVSSQSLLGVINDILDLSKIEAGKFSIVRSETNIKQLVKSVCDILKFKADEKGLSLVNEIDDRVPEVIIADSLRLNQILMNLLSNAIKFTHKGSVKLSVVAQEVKAGKVKLAFSVEDTGIGIPHNKLDNIFESFSQAEDDTTVKYGGTGLGLAITKKLCQLKGGTLSVKSSLGKGSVFTFINWFTSVEQGASKQDAESIQIIPFARVVRILLAEDNAINQFAATNLLKKWNVHVDVADTGSIALEKFRTNDYDLILMDTYMPGLSGYETTRKIRHDFESPKKDIPIVSLSAAVLEEEIKEARDAGMNAQVSKPFNPKVLYKTIKDLIGED